MELKMGNKIEEKQNILIIAKDDNNNTKTLLSHKINEIESNKQEDSDQNKNFVHNQIIIVQDKPKTFYYMYQDDEYYFTAKNAKFKIDINGNIIWYYGEWLDGFFRNGLWLDGTWHKGTFCRGNWLDGEWMDGEWYKGQINGSYSDKHP